MTSGSLFFDILVLLSAAVILVPMLQRFGIPSVLGYLAAGIALGPHTPGPIVDAEATRPLAELGVVFLLFAIGLELPLSRLRTMRSYIFGLGLLQMAVTGIVLGLVAIAVGLPPLSGLVVGFTLSMSSTAMVLALLVERNEVVAHHGRIAVSVLIFQDLAVIPLLAVLPVLTASPDAALPALGLAGLKAAIGVVSIFAFGRLVLRPAYAFIAASRNAEVFVAANLLLVLAIAWATTQAGMSMALGAFLGGLMLADSPYRHQVEADLQPFRGLLLGLFFMTVGLSIDLPFVAGHWREVLGITTTVMAVKTIVLIGLARLLRQEPSQGILVAFLLAQTGEFAFVVFRQATSLQLLPQADGHVLLAAVALSMVLTPLLAAVGRGLSCRRTSGDGSELAPSGLENLENHVVLAGYGRMGRTIARLLQRHGIAFIALDLDVDRVIQAHKDGLPVYYGDAGNAGVLRSVGIGGARAMVVTIGAPRATEHAIACVRQIAADTPVIVRAKDRLHEDLLHHIGAFAVIPETVEASLQMAGAVLRLAGIAEGVVERSLSDYRSSRYTRNPG